MNTLYVCDGPRLCTKKRNCLYYKNRYLNCRVDDVVSIIDPDFDENTLECSNYKKINWNF